MTRTRGRKFAERLLWRGSPWTCAGEARRWDPSPVVRRLENSRLCASSMSGSPTPSSASGTRSSITISGDASYPAYASGLSRVGQQQNSGILPGRQPQFLHDGQRRLAVLVGAISLIAWGDLGRLVVVNCVTSRTASHPQFDQSKCGQAHERVAAPAVTAATRNSIALRRARPNVLRTLLNGG